MTESKFSESQIVETPKEGEAGVPVKTISTIGFQQVTPPSSTHSRT